VFLGMPIPQINNFNMHYINYDYIQASKLAIGTSAYGSKVSKKHALRILHLLKEQGVNYIDTASSYGLGMSEDIIGDFTEKDRKNVFISTKVGIKAQPLPFYKKILLPIIRQTYNLSFLKKKAQTQSANTYNHTVLTLSEMDGSIAQSLKNLKTDYLDQLLIHNNFKTYLNDNAVVDLLENYKQKGIIRHIGITAEEPLNTEGVAILERNKTLVDTVQLPFHQYAVAPKVGNYTNYFSIFNKNNSGNSVQTNLWETCKNHQNGHFIVLMSSENNILKNCELFGA
jgi:aryl-alcohol dehydrogenase-like predicted oxidoreductase